MFVPGLGHVQASLQMKLSRCGIHQVKSAHDICDALVKVIHDDGKLVRNQSVLAPDDEITDARTD